VRGADALLRNVLQRLPDYQPAVARFGELNWGCQANLAEAIRYLEHSLQLDPRVHFPRRSLVRAYLELGDKRAVASVIASTSQSKDVLAMVLYSYEGDWKKAGEIAFDAVARELVTPLDEDIAASAIRHHARITGDYARAIGALETLSGVGWTADDEPVLSARPGLRLAAIGLADLLQLTGEPERAKRLLTGILERMQAELKEPARSELWYYQSMAVLLTLMGNKEGAIAWLQRGVASRKLLGDSSVWTDPALEPLRGDPRFVELLRKVEENTRIERAKLVQLRAKGLVPTRP
jgi:tetratricopeptide (TPR) repeat protein